MSGGCIACCCDGCKGSESLVPVGSPLPYLLVLYEVGPDNAWDAAMID